MNIILVCSGNICRSPMAEALMRRALARRGRGALAVLSAGVYAYDGDGPTDEAVRVMKDYGIDLRGHRARSLTRILARDALLLTMTDAHKRAILSLAPSANVYTLREYAKIDGGDIADPYGRGLSAYVHAAREIDQAIEPAADRITKEVR
jgi:protein-tyrosine phosphatase